MDPQPQPLLHFHVRMKPMSTNVFHQITKNVEVTRGKIWAVQRMLKCFPTKSTIKLIPLSTLAVWGWALLCNRMILFESTPGSFDFMEHRSFCNVFA